MVRRVLVVLLVVAVAWLGFRAVRAFDQDRHAAAAAAVLSAPDSVSYQLPRPGVTPTGTARVPEREGSPQPGAASGAVHTPGDGLPTGLGPGCRWWTWRGSTPWPETSGIWCSCATGRAGRWPGPARPRPDGTAQVRSGAEPRPPTIFEVMVTRAVDDATSVPHGQPVLQWFDASLGPPRARPFDFAKGV